MLCKEITAVYSENNMKRINTQGGEYVEISVIKVSDVYTNYFALKG
jgi:hypothetical protein